VSAPLPLAAAQERLGRRGRPRLSDEEKAARAERRRARQVAELLAVAPRLFAVPAAARYVGVSVWTLRGLISNGVLPRVIIPAGGGKDLRAVRLDRADLDALITAWKDSAR